MSKRKGVSAEEKRIRMLQIFHEKKEFFQLKDIEKIASNEKGIVVQTVKDVLQKLVDDGLVDTDKIGTSVYYWAFPGKNIKKFENNIEDANKSIIKTEMRIAFINEEILKEKIGKEDTIERQKLMQDITKLLRKEIELKKELSKESVNDPSSVAESFDKAQKYKEAANTWTDNIFAVQSWCKNKFDISQSDLNKQFHISDDLDYIE